MNAEADPQQQHPAAECPDALVAPRGLADLFFTFNWLSLQGFGGVLAVAQRELVERRRWLNREQFLELLAVGQVLPGPNIVNMALMFGDRQQGWRGAVASLAGLMVVPLAIVLALTVIYGRFEHLPAVSGALRGMGAVAAGLVLSTGFKLLGTFKRSPMGWRASAAFAVLTFALVAGLRWPLVWVIGAVGSSAVLLTWFRLAR